MATLSELRENPQALRKFFIFGAVLLAALGWLLLPSWLPHHSADAHVSAHEHDLTQAAAIKSPAAIAGGKSPIAGDPAPASGPAPIAVSSKFRVLFPPFEDRKHLRIYGHHPVRVDGLYVIHCLPNNATLNTELSAQPIYVTPFQGKALTHPQPETDAHHGNRMR